MQTRYREKLTYCGDYIRGEVYPTFRGAGKRRGKFRSTSEVQKRLNDRAAEFRLSDLIHANFTRRDIELDLTYADGNLPESDEVFRKDVWNYVTRVKRIYRKAGVELRYIVGKGWSGKGRPHVHMILTGGVSFFTLRECWGLGRVNWRHLEFDERGVVDLARYIAGQKKAGKAGSGHERKVGERRWSGSRNLVRPAQRTNVTRYSRAAMEEIADSSNPQRIFMDRYPGYCLSEFPEIRFNSVNKSFYLTFMLYKPDSDNLESYARRERRRDGAKEPKKQSAGD